MRKNNLREVRQIAFQDLCIPFTQLARTISECTRDVVTSKRGETRYKIVYLFLPHYNGISMMAIQDWRKPDQQLASDACLTGCGARCSLEYFHSELPKQECLREICIIAAQQQFEIKAKFLRQNL